MAQVRASSEFDAKAHDTDDEKLRRAAKLLVLDDLAESDEAGEPVLTILDLGPATG